MDLMHDVDVNRAQSGLDLNELRMLRAGRTEPPMRMRRRRTYTKRLFHNVDSRYYRGYSLSADDRYAWMFAKEQLTASTGG